MGGVMLKFGKTAACGRSLITLLQPWARHMCSEGPRSTHEQAGVLEAYKRLVESGRLKPDQNQRACAQRFQGLLEALSTYAPAVEKYEQEASAYRQRRRELRQVMVHRDRQRASAEGNSFSLRRLLQLGKSTESPSERIMREAHERELAIDAQLGPPPPAPRMPKGIYLHGSVGSGKSMLMDLFVGAVNEAGIVPRVRRVHFNDAMDELNRRMYRLQQEREQLCAKQNEAFLQSVAAYEHTSLVRDPIAAKQKSTQQAKLATRRLRRQLLHKRQSGQSMGNSLMLAKASLSLIRGGENVSLGWDSSSRTASLLCFDEMQVGDPYTAIALKGLLEILLDQGTVIVSTSNLPIRQLNSHGVHEELFTGFQERLLAACNEVELSVEQDYRLSFGLAVLQEGGAPIWHAGSNYFWPADAASAEALDGVWQQLLGDQAEESVLLHLKYGRTLLVPRAGPGVARFTFEELCGSPLGHPDYQAVAQTFHRGVLVSDVPSFSLQMRDRARRFITLVDELYNASTPLVISADALPMDLFSKTGDIPVLDLEGLQFETAISGSKLRRDLLAKGDVGALEDQNAALRAAKLQQSGITEQFAFARAVSRLFELTGRSSAFRSRRQR